MAVQRPAAGLFLDSFAAARSVWAKHVSGWVENAKVRLGVILVDAKLKIGAQNASPGVVDVKRFGSNDQGRVRSRIARGPTCEGAARQ